MKRIISITAALLITLCSWAQSPEKLSYQSVIRNAGNDLVVSAGVGMQISILQGSVSGTSVYVETQTPSTNINGLVSIEIGTGTVVSGAFNLIDWSTGPYFIKTETDPAGGTTYTITGTSQLMSVPYALYAKTSGNGAGPAGADGNDGADGVDGATGPQGPQGNIGSSGDDGVDGTDGIGIAQTLYVSGDTLFISSGNYIILPSSAPTLLGCTDSTALNYNSLANTDDGSCIIPFSGGIGDTHQGGIVFYLDGNGGGLIAAPTDQSTGAEWGCYGTQISVATGTAIGTGAQNTIDIEAGCTTSGTAADICANLTLGGYSDWFLPSEGELDIMYLNIGQGDANGLGNVSIFASTYYWSSTEFGSNSAWGVFFGHGNHGYIGKSSTTSSVRAVRAF
jgi:hypothetical protein